MKNARQKSFFNKKINKFFGGSLLKSNPRTTRPISTTQAIHLVPKSQHAVGQHSILVLLPVTRVYQSNNSKVLATSVIFLETFVGEPIHAFFSIGLPDKLALTVILRR